MKALTRLFAAIAAAAVPVIITAQGLPDFPLPSVPAELRLPADRADYIVRNFWEAAGDTLTFDTAADAFTAADNSQYSREALEQAFANLISIFPIASDSARRDAAASFLANAADEPSFSALAAIAEKYLYETDSPVTSDEYYAIFLHEILASPLLSDAARLRPLWQQETAMNNAVGSTFTPLTFTTREGAESSVESELGLLSGPESTLLLILYDPDCDHCRQTMEGIIADPDIAAQIADGALRVVALYSGDDLELWLYTAGELPDSWTVGYENGSAQENGSLIIRGLPTLFRIAPDGTILSKNIAP